MKTPEPRFVTGWTITNQELAEGRRSLSFDSIALAMRGPTPVPEKVRALLVVLFQTDQVRKSTGRPKKCDWIDQKTEIAITEALRSSAPRNLPLVTDWTSTLKELAEGRSVRYDILTLALRGALPIPSKVREFFAYLFESGKVKRPPGRPATGNWLEREIEHDLIVETYWMLLWEEQQEGKSQHGTPYERALHRLSQELRRYYR